MTTFERKKKLGIHNVASETMNKRSNRKKTSRPIKIRLQKKKKWY